MKHIISQSRMHQAATIVKILDSDVRLYLNDSRIALENSLDRKTNGWFSWPLNGTESESDLLRLIRFQAWNYLNKDSYKIKYVATNKDGYIGMGFHLEPVFWNGIDFTAIPHNAAAIDIQNSPEELHGMKYSVMAVPMFKKTNLDATNSKSNFMLY